MRVKLTDQNINAHVIILYQRDSGQAGKKKKPSKNKCQLTDQPHKHTCSHIILNLIVDVTWRREGEFQK